MLKVPKDLKVGPWFDAQGAVQQKFFAETPRESVRNGKANQIPLTSNAYMTFGDIGIPCQSPEFPQFYRACNNIYMALQMLANANAATTPAEQSTMYAEAAEAFENLEDFAWEVPTNSRFPTYCDNRVKIAAALKAASLYCAEGNLEKVEMLDRIDALNEIATSGFQLLSSTKLKDAKFSLLSTRACNESDRLIKLCQTNPQPEDVAAFVKHAATAIVLREKVETPSKELIAKTEELVGILQKYHSDAYETFLRTYETN